MAEDKVRINGAQYDYGSTSIKIGNVFLYGYTDVTWSHKRVRVKGQGAGKDQAAKGRGGGKYEVDNLKVKMRRDSCSFVKNLFAERASDGISYGNPQDVPIVMQYSEPDSNQDPITIEFVDCAIEVDGGGVTTDALDEVEMEFSVMKIDETINGQKRTLYNSAQ